MNRLDFTAVDFETFSKKPNSAVAIACVRVEDGQVVGRLVYEPLTQVPDFVYGTDIGSHYQRQGLKLSKHFRQE